MFFAVDLLIPQHGGKFALAWLAATRGVGHTAKKEIVACDIAKLCDEILQMVQSSSTRPRLRLSLSLASRLINGVTRIYRAQVEVFRDDVIAFLTTVRKPAAELPLSQESGETPVTPVTRPQRKRKRKTAQFSQELTGLPTSVIDNFTTIQVVVDEEELARPPAHQIDPALITLREELPIPPPDQMALELEEEQRQTFPHVLQDAPSFLLEEIPMPVIREKPKTRATLLKQTAEIPDISVQEVPVQFDIQPIADVPLQSEIQPIVEIPPQPEIQIVPHLEVEQVVDRQQDQSQIVPEAVEPAIDKNIQQVSDSEELIPPKTKKPQIVDKLTYKPIKKHRIAIDRCAPGDLEPFNVTELANRIPVQLVKAGSTNLCNAIDHSMMRTQAIENIIIEAPLSAKSRENLLRSSALLRIPRRGLSAKQDGTPVPEFQITPTIPQEVHQIITHADVHVTPAQQESLQLKEITESQFPATVIERFELPERTVQQLAESTQVQPMYMEEQITIHPPERTIEIEMPPAAEAPPRKEAVVKNSDEVGKRKILGKDRQKRIRDIIKNWNSEIHGPITLENVCVKPVNCLNVATAFNDLLCLQKMGYVKLHNKPNSLELGLIEKGERLLKK